MRVIIQRNGREFGPYSASQVQQFLAQGNLFPHDLAREDHLAGGSYVPLSQLMARTRSPSGGAGIGNPFHRAIQDLKALDMRLIVPRQEIVSLRWTKDRRLMYLAAVGLAPAIALTVAPGVGSAYWLLALYFSALWSLFFYYLFRTGQVETKFCVLCFFFTGIVSIAGLLIIQRVPPWTYLYTMAKASNLPTRFLGMFFGVGVHEELCKATVLFWLVRRPGKLLIPQTVVFYGMISGLGFGIYEGVAYQQKVNRLAGVDTAYFLNIARLTSLPFLHAVWTGIAGYYVAFAALYPRRRFGLWVLAITTPALFHATYNTFGWGLVGLGAAFLSVILLMTYLSNCQQMQQHLVATYNTTP